MVLLFWGLLLFQEVSQLLPLQLILHAGAHSITAVYSGGGGFDPSTSPVFTSNILLQELHLLSLQHL